MWIEKVFDELSNMLAVDFVLSFDLMLLKEKQRTMSVLIGEKYFSVWKKPDIFENKWLSESKMSGWYFQKEFSLRS